MSPTLKSGMLRFHDLAHGAAGHHLAEADRRCVGGGVAHAAALVGIERQIVHLHQHLAVTRLGHRRFLDAEVGFGGLARRAADEDDAAMGFGNAHERLPPMGFGPTIARDQSERLTRRSARRPVP